MLIMHHEDFKNDNDTYIELYAVKRVLEGAQRRQF